MTELNSNSSPSAVAPADDEDEISLLDRIGRAQV